MPLAGGCLVDCTAAALAPPDRRALIVRIGAGPVDAPLKDSLVAVSKLDELIVLIPSHSLEDFPSEVEDDDAAGMLNGFQILWDPRLLCAAGSFPTWHRADEVPEVATNRLIVVPSACEHLLPAGWIARAKGAGMTVVHGTSDRKEMLAQALDALEPATEEASSARAGTAAQREGVDEPAEEAAADVLSGETSAEVAPAPPSPIAGEMAGDFFALAFCYLQIQLVARHMRHFSNLDEAHFQNELLAAAQCAVEGDQAQTERYLRNCFEVLTEARERFYPVDAYLVDLALVDTPRRLHEAEFLGKATRARAGATERDERDRESAAAINVLIPAGVLDAVARDHPESLESLRSAVKAGDVEICGGEWEEADAPLLPLESLLWQFEQGLQCYRRHLGRTPEVYARRRYGLLPQLPQILSRFGYRAALHFALDDGTFPRSEQAKIRWEGPDGSVVDALTRIPLTADTAATYLRFPERLANTMDHDHVATLVFAHWPNVSAPWYEDLRRMARYSPVLGRWIGLERYFRTTETPGRITKFEPGAYRSAYLEQAVAAGGANPISRYRRHQHLRARLEEAWWLATTAALVGRNAVPDCIALESRLESVAPGPRRPAAPESDPGGLAEQIESFHAQSAEALAAAIMPGAGSEPGCLIINPLSFSRKVPVKLAGWERPPAPGAPVLASQRCSDGFWAVVEVPAMGFAWVSQASEAAEQEPGRTKRETSLAEAFIVRNEFFEVYVDEQTGGMRGLLDYRTESNRLGQQLALHLARRKAAPGSFVDPHAPLLAQLARGEPQENGYSRMVAESVEVTSAGPALGEIISRGWLIDPSNEERLAGFQQRYRAWKGRPVLELEISLDPIIAPGAQPWNSYYAARFAWANSDATVCAAAGLGRYVSGSARLESAQYVEFRWPRARTAVLSGGLPFHRRHGERMLDTLLLVRGEECTTAALGVAVECTHPVQSALDWTSPPVVIPTTSGPPATGNTGWLFQLGAANAMMTSMRPLSTAAGANGAEGGAEDGFLLRVVETEGRSVRTKLRLWRDPRSARMVDLQGAPLTELVVQDDTVLIDLTAHEIATIEIRLASSCRQNVEPLVAQRG